MHKLLILVIVILLVIIWCCRRQLRCYRRQRCRRGRGESFGGQKNKVVTLHYTTWCPACKRMKPIWDAVKNSIQRERTDIIFRENDEDASRTPGITAYPTILQLSPDGKTTKYEGVPDFQSLKRWILSPVHMF